MLPRKVYQEVSKQRGMITLEGLERAGVSDPARRSALSAGALVEVFPRVYRPGDFAETKEGRWMAACLWHPEAVLSHRTAAALHEFDGIDPIQTIEMLIPEGRARCPEGVELYRSTRIPPEDRTLVRGLRVTSKARTLVDLAAVVSEEELAYAVEMAQYNRQVQLDWLKRRLRQLRTRGRRGVQALQRVVDDCDQRGVVLQSPLEVRFWRRVRDAGLPLPMCQLPFDDDYGPRGYIDFGWPSARLAVETRGADHSTPEAFEKNSRRTARLTAMGWSVMPVTWSMLEENTPQVIQQVKDSLRERHGLVPVQHALF